MLLSSFSRSRCFIPTPPKCVWIFRSWESGLLNAAIDSLLWRGKAKEDEDIDIDQPKLGQVRGHRNWIDTTGWAKKIMGGGEASSNLEMYSLWKTALKAQGRLPALPSSAAITDKQSITKVQQQASVRNPTEAGQACRTRAENWTGFRRLSDLRMWGKNYKTNVS